MFDFCLAHFGLIFDGLAHSLWAGTGGEKLQRGWGHLVLHRVFLVDIVAVV